MRKKVKPPPPSIQQPISPFKIDEIKSSEHQPKSEKILLNEDGEKTLTFNSSNEMDDEKTTKKEPLKKRVFAKRGVQNRSHSNNSTPSSPPPFSSSSSSSLTKTTTSVSSPPFTCKVLLNAAAAATEKSSDAQESIEAVTAEIPTENLSSSSYSNFQSSTDLNNNNSNQSNLNKISFKTSKTSQKSVISKTETQSFTSSKYSVAGSQISLISNVMDKIEKGKHLGDESLASNRRLPEPLDEKKIATYAGIIALCVLTLIILGIAAFLVIFSF